MHISDFIDQYTYSEVQRVERRDVVDRFHNKLQMQKICSEQPVDALEMSPVRVAQRTRSPNVRRSVGSPSKRSPVRRSNARLQSAKQSPGRIK